MANRKSKKKASKVRRARKENNPVESISQNAQSILELIAAADQDLGKSVADSLESLEAPEEVLSALVESANELEEANKGLDSPVLAAMSERLVECHDAIAPTEGSGLEDGEPLLHEQVGEEITEAVGEQLEALREKTATLLDEIEQEAAQMAEQIDTLVAENDGLRERLEEYEDDEEDDEDDN